MHGGPKVSESANPETVDMTRWTFTTKPESRQEIEAYLTDLGADVVVLRETEFHVIWEEPDQDMTEVTSELWDLNEEAFEITQEDFHRLGHFLIHPEEETSEAQAA